MIICDLHCRRGEFSLDFSEKLPAHGITAITGRSGIGKTTLLRWMAGLEKMDNATFIVNDTVYQQGALFISAEKRAVGYVGQETQLLPFLNVEKNIAFAQKRASSDNVVLKPDTLIDIFAIGHCLNKLPAALSSGEKQRVAVIQSLLSYPKLLLLDEAFSAIDEARKQMIWQYLADYFVQMALPVIYVSHDQQELGMINAHHHIQLS